VADLSAIPTAIADQISAHTGIRAHGQAPDSIQPPVIVVLAGNPLDVFGATMDGAMTLNYKVLIILTDAPSADRTQRALDAYLSSGQHATVSSVPAAIEYDTTLGKLVDWCIPKQIAPPGRIDYGGVLYFGVVLDLEVGTR
jgi:hypothetical protein